MRKYRTWISSSSSISNSKGGTTIWNIWAWSRADRGRLLNMNYWWPVKRNPWSRKLLITWWGKRLMLNIWIMGINSLRILIMIMIWFFLSTNWCKLWLEMLVLHCSFGCSPCSCPSGPIFLIVVGYNWTNYEKSSPQSLAKKKRPSS